MRLDKSFRVILNSPIFPKMTVERATDRSVRFGAQDESQLRVFIIKVIHYSITHNKSCLIFFFFAKSSTIDCTNLCRELQSRIEIIERQQPILVRFFQRKTIDFEFVFYFRTKVLIQQQLHHHQINRRIHPAMLVNDLILKVIPMFQIKLMIFRKNPKHNQINQLMKTNQFNERKKPQQTFLNFYIFFVLFCFILLKEKIQTIHIHIYIYKTHTRIALFI